MYLCTYVHRWAKKDAKAPNKSTNVKETPKAKKVTKAKAVPSKERALRTLTH